MITCLNCSHSFKGKFCPNCGQKATVKRITLSVLLEDVVHFFTHLESGFLFTTWNFLINPGRTASDYVGGKRKEHQKPVSYFFIWTGLYILVHNTIINYFHYQITAELAAPMNIGEQSNILFRRHFTLFIIPVIFLSAFLLYQIMAKPRYNFIEILAMSLYGTGTYFMMSLVSDVFLGIFLKSNILTANVFLWQGILSSLYNFWFSFDFFKRLRVPLFWLRLIGVSILIAIGGWLIMFYLPMAWIYFQMHSS